MSTKFLVNHTNSATGAVRFLNKYETFFLVNQKDAAQLV